MTLSLFCAIIYTIEDMGVKMSAFDDFKKLLDEYVADGGNIDDLTKGDKVYNYIKDRKVVKEDGTRYTMEEKFALSGYPRTPKKARSAFDKIGEKISEYVNSGKSLEDLKSDDPLYKYIKNVHLRDEDGKLIPIKEILAMFGEERSEKHSKNVKIDLIEEIEKYRTEGGSFHVRRKSLPFYDKLRTYCRSQDMLPEEAMKSLGYKDYSNLYYTYGNIDEIKKFRDKDGYVDSYRSDDSFKSLITSAADFLKIPVPLVVMLVCDENLKEFYLQTEYYDYVRQKMEDYISRHGDLEGISSKDPVLYEKYRKVRTMFLAEYGEAVTNDDVLFTLGFEDIKNKMKDKEFKSKDIKEIMYEAKTIAEKNGGVLSREDLENSKCRAVAINAAKLGVPVKELFRVYEVDYAHGKKIPRLSRVKMQECPYINEMRERRDQLMRDSGVSIENGNCKEEVFEKRVEAALQAYSEYADLFEKKYDEEIDKDLESIEKREF